jgi:hypothetical protein
MLPVAKSMWFTLKNKISIGVFGILSYDFSFRKI